MRLRNPAVNSFAFAFLMLISTQSLAQQPKFELIADVLSLGEDFYLTAPEGFAREGAGQFTVAPVRGPKGEALVVVGYGTMLPFEEEALPLRIIEFGTDGIAVDRTEEIIEGELPRFEHPRQFIFEDFNEDGALDIYVAGHGFDTDPFAGEPNGLLLTTPDGKYRNATDQVFPVSDFSHAAAAGDVNADGHLDLFVPSHGIEAPDLAYFLLGDGDGSFERDYESLPTDDPSWPQFTTFESNWDTAALIDANGDGVDDLVMGRPSYGDDLLFLNPGNGDFSEVEARVMPTGLFGEDNFTLAYTVLDINRDGLDDLIAVQSANYVGYGLQILISKGDGDFLDETDSRLKGGGLFTEAAWVVFAHLADINADGFKDLWLIGAGNDIVLWINDREGGFEPQTWQASGQLAKPESLAVIDFTGDDYPDAINIFHNGPSSIGYDSYAQVNTLQLNAGLNDAWYNPATAGQGVFINVFPFIRKLFLAMFTFDTADATPGAASLGGPRQRWLTAFGSYEGRHASLSVELTSGGVFNDPDTKPSQESGYGTIDLIFPDCGSLVLDYSFPASTQSGRMHLQRVVNDNVALCTAINEELQ